MISSSMCTLGSWTMSSADGKLSTRIRLLSSSCNSSTKPNQYTTMPGPYRFTYLVNWSFTYSLHNPQRYTEESLLVQLQTHASIMQNTVHVIPGTHVHCKHEQHTISKQPEYQHPNQESALAGRGKTLQQSKEASRLTVHAFVNAYAAPKTAVQDLQPIVYEPANTDQSLFPVSIYERRLHKDVHSRARTGTQYATQDSTCLCLNLLICHHFCVVMTAFGLEQRCTKQPTFTGLSRRERHKKTHTWECGSPKVALLSIQFTICPFTAMGTCMVTDVLVRITDSDSEVRMSSNQLPS